MSKTTKSTNRALEPDLDTPNQPGLEFAQFAAGCFWGVELAFQRLEGVVKTEVGYSQGHVDNPNYKLVCTGSTNHADVRFSLTLFFARTLICSLFFGLAIIAPLLIVRVVMLSLNTCPEYPTIIRPTLN